MKLKFKKEPSHNEDICDVAKCKYGTDIILRYMEIYEDGIIDLCRNHYKQHLDGIEDWDKYYRDKIKKRDKFKFIGIDYAKEGTKDKSVSTEKPSMTLEEYTKNTGKRFRMAKEQKSRGLDREAAFREFIQNNNA